MRGNVSGFDSRTGTGMIGGQDGKRYSFVLADWRGPGLPLPGVAVDFTPTGDKATEIHALTKELAAFSWRHFLLSRNGRIPRSFYWLRYTLPYFLISLVLIVLDIVLGLYDSYVGIGMFSTLFQIIAIWPSIAVAAKRCHDRGRSGWFLLIGLVPVIGSIWLFIDIGLLRGTVGDNRFGPDPTPE